MYEKNGEKYFVVDARMHFGTPAGRTGSPVASTRQGLDRLLLRLPQAGPAGDPLGLGALPQGLRGRPDEGRLRGRPTWTRPIFQSTYLKYWYKDGFNTVERNAFAAEQHPDKFIMNGRWVPRTAKPGPAAGGGRRRWNLQGVKLYTAEWHENGSRGWKLAGQDHYGSWRSARSWASPTSTRTRARRSGR